MLRKFLAAAVFLCAAGCVAGCQVMEHGTAGSGQDQTEKTTLVWAVWDTGQLPFVQDVIDAYEAEHPDIEIRVEEYPTDGYDFSLESDLMSEDHQIDCMLIKDIPGYLSLAKKQLILPVEETDFSDSGIQKDLMIDGNMYTRLCRSDFNVLYYNTELLDTAGMEYPANDMTFEEYDAMVREVSEKASEALGNHIYGVYYHTWRSTVQDFALLDGKHTLLDGDYEFLRPVYEMVLEQQADGICPPYLNAKLDSMHYSTAFYSNRVAVMPMGTWFLPNLIQAAGNGESQVDRWGIASMPHADGAAQDTSVAAITGVSISSSSAYKKEAKDFVDFLCGQEGAEILAETGTMPALRNEKVTDIISSQGGFPQDESSRAALETGMIYYNQPLDTRSVMAESILGEIHEKIMLGELSLDEGLARMREEMETVLKES